MKIKHLFLMMLALSLTVASCEPLPADDNKTETPQPDPDPAPDPEPQPDPDPAPDPAPDPEPEPEPTPEPDIDPTLETINFDATHLDGIYYADMYSPRVPNHYVWFSDLGLGQDYAPYLGGTYYRLDIYTYEFYDGISELTIPAGTYTLDLGDTMASGTIGYQQSLYFTIDESGMMTERKFSWAKLVVDQSGLMTLSAAIDRQRHEVTFNGAPNIDNIMDL